MWLRKIVRHGGTVICAAVSPYRATRNEVRSSMPDHFVEVFVDTPLEVCEDRDTKGMYAKARRGEIQGFTGVDDPYEAPENPEIVLDTVDGQPEENARRIIDYLKEKHFSPAGCLMGRGKGMTTYLVNRCCRFHCFQSMRISACRRP